MNPSRVARAGKPHSTARYEHAGRIGRLAVRALYQELAAYPKPGLVSPVDAGSHDDMDAATFLRSLFSLRQYYREIAALGAAGASFEALRQAGIAAEARMLAATAGVNTHRGAVFSLGLLAAAAGRRGAQGQPSGTLGNTVRALWGSEIRLAARNAGETHGSLAALRYGVGGARDEAAGGFPHVYGIGLPALRCALGAGIAPEPAAVEAFFALLVHVSDTNLLHRAALAGLRYARRQASSFLAAGGVRRPDWLAHAQAIHRAFVARNLSPGGCADLLAATLFVHALGDG